MEWSAPAALFEIGFIRLPLPHSAEDTLLPRAASGVGGARHPGARPPQIRCGSSHACAQRAARGAAVRLTCQAPAAEYLLVVIVAVVLTGSNVIGFTRCSRQARKQLRDMASNAISAGLTVEPPLPSLRSCCLVEAWRSATHLGGCWRAGGDWASMSLEDARGPLLLLWCYFLVSAG